MTKTEAYIGGRPCWVDPMFARKDLDTLKKQPGLSLTMDTIMLSAVAEKSY